MNIDAFVAVSNAAGKWPRTLSIAMPLRSTDREKEKKVAEYLAEQSKSFVQYHKGINVLQIGFRPMLPSADTKVINVSAGEESPEKDVALVISFEADSRDDGQQFCDFANKKMDEVLQEQTIKNIPDASAVCTESIVVAPFAATPQPGEQ